MSSVKVGKTTFNSASLSGISLTDAYVKFSNHDKQIVKMAHELVNGKKTSRKKKSE